MLRRYERGNLSEILTLRRYGLSGSEDMYASKQAWADSV